MREILFRGKTKRDNKWVYGGIVHQTDYYGKKCDRWFIIDGTDTQDYDIGYEYEVIPETVGQYTGLTDKNGVKIFVGDIVAWRDTNFILSCPYTYSFGGYKYGDELLVRQLESGFMLCRKNDSFLDIPNANSKIDNYSFWNTHRFLEVIGNIHDNPELLEGN